MAVEVKLTSHLGEVTDALSDAVRLALEAVGVQAVSHAQANVKTNYTGIGARSTGNLRNSIVHEVEDNTVVIGTNVFYAPYVEYGTGIYAENGGGRQTPWVYQDREGVFHTTRGAQPRPFLRPAIENNIDEYRDIFESELSKRMNRK